LDELTETMERLIPSTQIVSIPRIDHWSVAPELTGLLS
jgi:hypothetical protein